MKSEICVPTAALAMPGEGEGQATPPAMGDSVDFSGTATVSRIEGEEAYLQVETVNGQPVKQDTAQEENMDQEEAALRRDAQKSDGPQVY